MRLRTDGALGSNPVGTGVLDGPFYKQFALTNNVARGEAAAPKSLLQREKVPSLRGG